MEDYEVTPLRASEGAAGGSTIALFLALYLLVLAFFILLVTISSLEEVKTQAVMDSLTSSFTSVMMPTTDLTDFTSKEGDVLAGQEFQEQVTGIFATALQVAKIEVVQPGRLMRVLLPADALFLEGEATIRPARYPMLDRVVAALSARPPGQRYDMEMVIGADYALGRTLAIGQTLPMARAGTFAREMASRGVPPDSISIGMIPDGSDDVVIWFYVRTPEETRLNFRVPGQEAGAGGGQ